MTLAVYGSMTLGYSAMNNRWLLLLLLCLLTSAAAAEPMRFEIGDSGGNACCMTTRWVQASGEITPETPKAFEAFMNSVELPLTAFMAPSTWVG